MLYTRKAVVKMARINIELNHKQVEEIVEKLPIEEKLQLVRRLERETLRERWNDLLKIIDARMKKYPLSEREVIKEIGKARKEHYAKCRN